MKIYNEQIALQSQKAGEVFNITTRVKAAVEKSAVREGMVLVSSLNSATAIIVNNDDDPGLLGDMADWLADVASAREARNRQSQESGHLSFQSALLPHQIMAPITEGRLELGAGQAVLLVERDGLRPRRVVVKAIGE